MPAASRRSAARRGRNAGANGGEAGRNLAHDLAWVFGLLTRWRPVLGAAMQSVLVAAQEVQIFVGQKVSLASALGRHVAPRPALEGAPLSQPCQADRSACRRLAGRAHGCGPRVPLRRRGSAPMPPVPRQRRCRPTLRPARRRAQPDLAAGGLAHQFERRAGAQRSSRPSAGQSCRGGGRLARRYRTSISTRANFFAMRGASCRCWRQARVCHGCFCSTSAMIVALRHALPRTLAPWKAGSIIVP